MRNDLFRLCRLALALNVAVGSDAFASHLRPIEVTIPVRHENGVDPSAVTFMVWGEALIVGEELFYVAVPYLIPVQDGELEQRNAASTAGVKVSVDRGGDLRRDGLYGDTLRVVCDFSAVAADDEYDYAELVAATKAAILENACRSLGRWPGAANLDLRLVPSLHFPGDTTRVRLRLCEESESL